MSRLPGGGMTETRIKLTHFMSRGLPAVFNQSEFFLVPDPPPRCDPVQEMAIRA